LALLENGLWPGLGKTELSSLLNLGKPLLAFFAVVAVKVNDFDVHGLLGEDTATAALVDEDEDFIFGGHKWVKWD
jgi:hypothetical protein